MFPPRVDAHSESLPEDRIEDSEEVQEEVKKKKHRREKIGFRDRKVSVNGMFLFISFFQVVC